MRDKKDKKNKIFDKIYNALQIIPWLSAPGVLIFVHVGLITNMDKNQIILIAWIILMTTVAISWLVSRICMELDIDEDDIDED